MLIWDGRAVPAQQQPLTHCSFCPDRQAQSARQPHPGTRPFAASTQSHRCALQCPMESFQSRAMEKYRARSSDLFSEAVLKSPLKFHRRLLPRRCPETEVLATRALVCALLRRQSCNCTHPLSEAGHRAAFCPMT